MSKILIGSELGSYSFNKTAKTITFSGFNASLERILLITDVTNSTTIYQFNDAAKNGTLANNVLTLTYNTNVGGFADSDILQIFYWSEEPEYVALKDLSIDIKKDLMAMNHSRGNMQNSPTGIAIASLPTLASVTTVTNITQFGSISAEFNLHLTMRNNFNNWKDKVLP